MSIGIGKKTAAVAIAAAVTLGAGGVAAWAESTSGSTATLTPAAATVAASGTTGTSGSAAAGTAGRRAARIAAVLRRTDHASLEVKTKTGWLTVDYDRGTLSKVSGDQLTLARPDGQSVTLTVTPSTKFRGITGLGQLQTGATTLVLSNADGTARTVAQKAAATPTAP